MLPPYLCRRSSTAADVTVRDRVSMRPTVRDADAARRRLPRGFEAKRSCARASSSGFRAPRSASDGLADPPWLGDPSGLVVSPWFDSTSEISAISPSGMDPVSSQLGPPAPPRDPPRASAGGWKAGPKLTLLRNRPAGEAPGAAGELEEAAPADVTGT